jgi:hypothetical protein
MIATGGPLRAPKGHDLQLAISVRVGDVSPFASFRSAFAGRSNSKVAPRSGLRVARRRPPWFSIIERTIASPIPIPCGLVVKKASNNRGMTSGSIPLPESRTETWICLVSDWLARISTSRGPSGLSHTEILDSGLDLQQFWPFASKQTACCLGISPDRCDDR